MNGREQTPPMLVALPIDHCHISPVPLSWKEKAGPAP
jgi:hypothetical protein